MQTRSSTYRRNRALHIYVVCAALFAVLMVLTNIIGTKLFVFLPNVLPAGFGSLTGNDVVILTTGILAYPLTFLLTDVVAEIFGKKRADFMVALGFGASLVMLGALWLGVSLPRADRYWSDASGQWSPGTTILAAPTANNHLLVDDHHEFLTEPTMTAAGAITVAVLPANATAPLPIPPAFVALSGSNVSKGRWDQRGHLEAATTWPETAQPGNWIVPAVQVTMVSRGDDNSIRIRVDRPAALPPNGTLLDSNGWRWQYQQRSEAGELSLNRHWQTPTEIPATVPNGSHLAVANTLATAQMQTAYSAAFAAPALLLFASMTAYLVAQLLDVWLFHFWRRITKGRHLWLRNNGSTWISQLADTIIVNGIFLPLAFGMDMSATVKVIIAVYLVKIALAVIDTPLIYAAVWLVKRMLGYRFHETVPELLADAVEPQHSAT